MADSSKDGLVAAKRGAAEIAPFESIDEKKTASTGLRSITPLDTAPRAATYRIMVRDIIDDPDRKNDPSLMIEEKRRENNEDRPRNIPSIALRTRGRSSTSMSIRSGTPRKTRSMDEKNVLDPTRRQGAIIMRKGYPRRFFAALVLGLALASSTEIPRGWMEWNAARAAEPPIILMLGDSLTAGYGLPAADALPARLEDALSERYLGIRVINAGVSGDTIAQGLARLEWVLADRPDAVIVALGANDALRAIDPGTSRSHLDRILAELEKRELPVLLAGMKAPRNLGLGYTQRFDAIYPDLAERYDALLYPFLLEGVAAIPELNLMVDGNPDLHPNRKGVMVIVERMLPMVICLVERIEGFEPSTSTDDPKCA